MKKVILLFISLCCFGLFAEQREYRPFELSIVKDSVIIGSGSVIAGTSIILDKIIELNKKDKDDLVDRLNKLSVDGSAKCLDDLNINYFDRLIVNNYSRKLDIVGTGICGISLLAPISLFLVPDLNKNDYFTIGTMYVESLMFAYGVKQVLKIAIERPRPYMYSSDYPMEYVDDGDWINSFPSGHTTFAFTGATFCSYMFCKYWNDSPYKIPVIAVSYTMAFATAALRIASGNHFMTDVLAGAAIGTVCGFIIPYLHTTNLFGVDKKNKSNNSVSINITPLSFLVKVNM